MARVLSTAVVLALLTATALAFVVTERAKLEKSPITGTRVTAIFSPNAVDPKLKNAVVSFRLRTTQRIEAWIQDSNGSRVRLLQAPRTFKRGTRVDLVWDGFTDTGTIVPDGVYMPVVKLSHRIFVLPSEIRLDTKPPVITVRHPQYPILSPDGDGRHDSFTVPYRINERGNAILAVRGTQVEFTRCCKQVGELHWNGRLGNPPRPVRPGRYLLTVAARDEAGNQSKPFPFAIAQVRYITLARDRVVVRPGGKFALRVSADTPTVRWTLHGRSGTQRTGTLHFTAPKSVGVYRLYVTAGAHAASCTVVVA
ncbi:MAG: hypothetical protein QOF28_2001 [Actinomycetota bacterium]|nr:hypothetical protein [Actinomycetota bacterium]